MGPRRDLLGNYTPAFSKGSSNHLFARLITRWSSLAVILILEFGGSAGLIQRRCHYPGTIWGKTGSELIWCHRTLRGRCRCFGSHLIIFDWINQFGGGGSLLILDNFGRDYGCFRTWSRNASCTPSRCYSTIVLKMVRYVFDFEGLFWSSWFI